MFGVSAAAWDTRTPWARFLEHAAEHAHPFRSVIAPHAQVFWPGDRVPAWQVLRRPAWYSVDQGAGIVFSRGTALEFAARTYATLDLRTADMTCVFLSRAADGKAPCSIEPRLARALCERRDGPDYLVLHAPIAGRAAVEWRLPPEVGPAYRMLYLYACRDLTQFGSISAPIAGLRL